MDVLSRGSSMLVVCSALSRLVSRLVTSQGSSDCQNISVGKGQMERISHSPAEPKRSVYCDLQLSAKA